MEKKDLRHITDEQISLELEEKDREYISSMGGWIESKQLPILTEKIILLSKRIKDLNDSTRKYSRALIFLTIVMIILIVYQIYLAIPKNTTCSIVLTDPNAVQHCETTYHLFLGKEFKISYDLDR